MAKINVTAAPGGGSPGSGTVTSVAVTSSTLTVTGSPITTAGTIVANIPDGFLKVGTGVTGTLQNVTDTSGTASQLFLSTTGIQATSKIQITTAETSYIDAEDNSGNNRFTVGRDPSSQLVTVDFASVPTALTTPVGAIRTATDGVTLANVMTFLENGNIGLGTDTPGSKFDVHSAGATVAQFNKTVSGNSYIQQLTAGAAKWKHGFTTATGAFDIIDDVNSLTRLSVLNTGQLKLNAYTSTSAFTGTTAGFLAFDSSGNILSVTSPATSPAGTTGAVQFNNAGAFGADNTNFFWDNTNKRLGIGTATPTALLNVKGASGIVIDHTADTSLAFAQNGTTKIFMGWDSSNNGMYWFTSSSIMNLSNAGNLGLGGVAIPTARLQVKGSGSTSATTSLLVQNSSAVTMAQVKDNGEAYFNIDRTGNGFQIADGGSPTQQTVLYQKGGITQTTTRGSSSLKYFIWSSNASEFPNGHFGYNFDQFIISDIQKDLDAAKKASAVLQADSTSRGFLPPRMTTTQKNAIATPAAGLMVYDTTLNKLCVYTTAWETITSL